MTSPFMTIEMGQAAHGDSLLVQWGGAAGSHRMLIDGGPIGTYKTLASRLADLPADQRLFELVVLSHVDTDHIEGMLRLFAEPPERWPLQVKDVWFNGWDHLVESDIDVLGGRQGEYFSALLQHRLAAGRWNGSFGGRAVVRPDDALPVIPLDGGLKLTLLSPTRVKLGRMSTAWRKDLKDTPIEPGDAVAAWQALGQQKKYVPADFKMLNSTSASIEDLLERQFKPDGSAANGSSIAFLAEQEDGPSCLFLADAHADVIVDALQQLVKLRNVPRLRVDAVKLAHHGSRNNTDERLLALIDSQRYLFSSSGAIFKHPDEEVVARILAGAQGRPLELCFNYLSDITRKWADPALQAQHHYRAVFPEGETGPLFIDLGQPVREA